MGRPREYELRWTGNIKPNGQKELVWVKIKKVGENDKPNDISRTLTIDTRWHRHSLDAGKT